MSTEKRAGMYLRVSTDGQTTDNQRAALLTVARNNGWTVAAVFEDAGISGSGGRDRRPGFAELHRAIVSREIDVVMAWSVDRLGRSLPDLLAFLGELQAKSVDLFLLQQGIDTGTPAGRAMFQMLGVFAEFERSLIRERVRAGLMRAKTQGKRLGRPRVSETKRELALAARAQGHSFRQIAASLHIGASTVAKITASDG